MAERASARIRLAVIVVAVVALAILIAGIVSRRRSEHQLASWTRDQAAPSVAVIRPKPVGAASALTLPADVQAFNSAPIYARSNGYVRKWLVDIGQTVRAGQLLAVIDAPEIDQQFAASQANLQTALANQALAKTTADRWATMLARDAVSRQEADEKAGDYAAKTAVANAARADVARLKATQGFSRLVAPFAGVVTSRATQIGALVTAGSAGATPLFTVSDVHRMRIYVKLPQAYSGQIHPGMTVTLSLPEYPGRSFTATLVRTAGAIDPQSGTVLVELQADNPDRALKPGAYAQASIPLGGGATVLTLPASALITGSGGTQVAVLQPGNVARFKSIVISRDDGNRVEISAGLAATDKVIDSPPDSLQSGDAVRVVGKVETNAKG